ncbi:Integrase protein [Bacteroides ovatus]|uniref:tyrosine-type recombinase/integrase n=1 Tax=Bacteroides ovatus TaxID=28116 RepID=UPI0020A6E258|nr:site-specific integrase [Bacteroides ovatus]CAG9889174.1 Integrase protein [Bacteroides ovatus]
MRKDGFTVCANNYINCLRQEGRYATAHVYENALRSFTIFCGTECVSFSLITRENLKRYSSYLMSCRLKLNTISTYMRMLRCIYNKGVDTHQAPYIHRLFRDVFTGVDTRQKKAIPINELHTLLYKDPQSEKLRRTQAIANLLFLFCGMPFADLVHLEKSNLEGNILKYNRIKTGTPMSIEILESASCIVSRLRNTHSAVLPEHPDYLFYILSGKNKRDDEAAYIEYQSTLRRFNNDLKSLAKKLRIHSSVTSYTFRHSWATTAKYRGVPIEMISESLGHKSIKTTQIYLKGFELNERTKVNRLNYSYVRNYRGIL